MSCDMAFWKLRSNSNDNYHTLRWYGTNVGIRTPTGYLTIQHDKKNNALFFYSDGLGRTAFDNLKALLSVLLSHDHRIYLEWCQEETGSYVYFDLFKLTQTLQQYTSIDINLLNINQNSNRIDKSCYFDESVPIESQLRKTDYLILSPLRSILARYTPMGIYEGHQLYLGPVPSDEFIQQFKIKYIFNCCQKQNIRQYNNITERLFNVASWKWDKKYVYKPLKVSDEQKSNDTDIKMNRMEYLDVMIDEIHMNLKKGNIVIHCLAGAHRSPFITGCYLYKYGLKGPNNSPQDIYKHMKQKRSIVQELGYDKQLNLYQKYLKKKYPHSKAD